MDKYTKDFLHLRINTAKSFADSQKIFQKTFIKERFVMGFEVSHLHVYIELAKLQWYDKVKDSKISKWIKESFDVKGSQYSVSKVRKKKQVKKYILKDGEYFAQGFSPEELLPFYKVSNKKGLNNMGLALADLEMDYMSDKIDNVTFYEKYVKLKVDYGQNIY